MCSFFGSQKKSVLFLPQGKSERMELLDDFFERFFAEISDFYHILFGFACQILDCVDARALQTVETTNGLNCIPKTWFTLMVRKPAAVQYQVSL